MKNHCITKYLPIAFLFFTSFIIINCSKGDSKTGLQSPQINTSIVQNITQNSVQTGGIVSTDGGSKVTTRGICWRTSENPTVNDQKTSDGDGIGTYTSEITGLIPETKYFARAYATNTVGTSYGENVIFYTTPNPITDNDGNSYRTITIGTQVWMAENLRTTKYSDGTPIENVSDSSNWSTLSTSAYCWYNNDLASNKSIYGALYNWNAVNSKKLSPAGWHIPTDAEWTTLVNYLGGSEVAGGKLKEIGTQHWNSPNTGADNSSYFRALPGGIRNDDGTFYYFGAASAWWSATEVNDINAYSRYLNSDKANIYSNASTKKSGFYIRCVRD